MTCHECTYNMESYLTQTLSSETLNAMVQHLMHCSQCQQQLLVLERINQMVALDRKSMPSGDTEARVMGAIEALSNKGQGGVVVRMRRALLVASVAASLGAGIMLGNLVQPRRDAGYDIEELTYLNDMEMEGFYKLIIE